MHLLRTACQEPDEQLLQSVSMKNQSGYWMYLKPVGVGWEVLIQYIYDHIEELKDYDHLIFNLITEDWARKLDPNLPLPIEAEAAGKLLCRFIEIELKKNSLTDSRISEEERFSKSELEIAIEVLFSLSEVMKDHVRDLIERANSYTEKKGTNFKLRDFYNLVINKALSGLSSRKVCEELPDLVCTVALNNWLIEPLEDEDQNSYPLGHDEFDPFGTVSTFGLNRNVELEYFPAGIYKTPIRFLLYFHPIKALQLIITIINAATEAYIKSERGKRSYVIETEIHNNDGSLTMESGSVALWGMYRGSIVKWLTKIGHEKGQK